MIGFAKTSQTVFHVPKGWTYALTNAVKLSIQQVRSTFSTTAFVSAKKIFLSIFATTSQPQAKINTITHSAGEITVEVLDIKHNIETLGDRLTGLQDYL